MICKECGIENESNALYCAHCGSKLEERVTHKDGRTCTECGGENSVDAKFCCHCGTCLKRHHHEDEYHTQLQVRKAHQKKKERCVETKFKWRSSVVVLVLLGSAFVSIAGIELFVKKQPAPPPPQILETRSTDLTLETKVQEIASKFICSCGTCGEKPLDTCTCNTAIKERQFIRNYLQSGRTSQQVIAAIYNTYGWIKPEFASLVGDTTARISETIKKNLLSAKVLDGMRMGKTVGLAMDAKPATQEDRIEIFSHFSCPCGQCGVDELKDCSCQHPRGATEEAV